MRPLALHIEGFGVFREPVDISFTDVDYFALVGPTGSGKSTVIDAICFALYGSVPRYGDERLVGRVVSLGKQETKVSLKFTVGTATYQATRVVRVKDGKASTPEAVLEQVADDEQPSRMLAERARDMKPAVEQLLGLPFSHFTKCVVLPQGEFAQFLHDEPSKRQDFLSRLLDLAVYDRIGRRARERAAAAKSAIEVHEKRLAELAFATDDSRAEAQQRLTALRSLHEAVQAAGTEDERLAADIAATRQRAELATTRIAELQSIALPEDLDNLAKTAADAAAVRNAAAEAVVAARAEVARLDAEIAALPDRDALLRAAAAHTEIAAMGADTEAAAAALAAAVAASDTAAASAMDADESLHAAQRAVTEVSRDHAAHALAADLVAGEPCPVCMQNVATVPPRKRPAAVSGAEKALAAAQKTADKARAAATRATSEIARAESRAAAIKDRLDTLALAVANNPDAAAVAAALTAMDATIAAHKAARRHEQECVAREHAAGEAEAAALERTTGLRKELERHRDSLLRGGSTPPDIEHDIAASWKRFAVWTASALETEAESLAATRLAAETLRTQQLAMLEALVERAGQLGVGAEVNDLRTLRDLVVQHGSDAKSELQRIDEAIDTAGKLREQVAAAVEEHAVAELLGTHMRSDRFEKWVLVEALEVLVASASVMLRALSGNQYSLRYSENEEFIVVDHRNADAVRSVRTLSGGETFQASLALALALSDQIVELAAGGGAKLEAIFLDEGFGTLDADTLETVAETLETLGTEGRMVGVVTHVPALAERVPVRYRVTRTDRAATVEREDA